MDYRSYDMKTCSKCGEIKPFGEFGKRTRSKNGLCSRCKICRAAEMKKYFQENKEKKAEYDKKYGQEHKEERMVHRKKYEEKRKEEIVTRAKKYRQEHKVELAAWQKKYFQTLEGKAASRKGSHKRRAQKMGVLYEIFDPVKIFERDGWRCQHCHKKVRWLNESPNHPLYPNLDHIIALKNGGAHTKQNTQLLCRRCNVVKHTNDIGEQLRLFG